MKRFVTCSLMASLFLFWANEYGKALPPLGLTPVGDVTSANLEITGGSAYIGAGGSVFRVDGSATVTVAELMHPQFGTPTNVTRAVRGPDGKVYVGANFGPSDPFFVPDNAAVFRLEEPIEPVMTWMRNPDTGRRPWVLGIDRTLRVLGNLVNRFSDPNTLAAEFDLDGSVEFLEHPSDTAPFVTDVSTSGYALGEGHVPGTIGSGVVLWTPSGSFSFVDTAGVAESLRDRLDGQGVNVGYNPGVSTIVYGEHATFFLSIPGDPHVIVSQSDFALIGTDASQLTQTELYFAFFPGIVPDDPMQAVPLFDVLPELASVNFDRITDLAAVDGRIYMTLVGEDGLYLFGARDPSVIPEPATVVLALLLSGGVFGCRRRIFRRHCDASAVF